MSAVTTLRSVTAILRAASPRRVRLFALAAASLLSFAAVPARAQTTWIGTSGDWTTGSNWSSGSAPAKSSVFNNVVFNASGVTSNLNENWTVQNVTINAGTGGGLTLSQSGDSALSFFEFTANASATVSANLFLLNQAFDTARTFNVASGATLTLSGVIAGAGGNQSMFEKTGAGTVVLSGSSANTFASDLRILAGTLRLEKSSGNAVVTNTTINSGGTLRLGADDQISDAHDVTVNSGGTFDLAGRSDTINRLVLNSGGTLTDSVGGSVLGISTAPTLVAGSDLSFKLKFAAAGIDFNVPDGVVTDDLALSGVLSGTHGFTKSGDGQLKLAGADANTFTGAVTVAAGTLLLVKTAGTAANNYGAAIGGDLTISTGATVRLGASDQHSDTKLLHVAGGTLDLNGWDEGVGTGGLRMTGGTISGPGTFNLFGDTATLANADTATISSNVALGSGTRTFTVADGAAANDLLLTGVLAGTGALVKAGDGQLKLGGAAVNTFSGTTTVNAGVLVLAGPAGGPANNYGGALRGPLTVNAGGRVMLDAHDQHDDTQLLAILGGTLELNGWNEGTGSGGLQMQGGTISGAGTFNLGSTLTALASASTATVSSSLFLLNGSRTLDVADGAASIDLSLSGAISGGSLVKTGAGTLALGGTNTFADGFTLAAGTVRFSAAANLGTGALTLNGGTLAPQSSLTLPTSPTLGGAVALAPASGTTFTVSGIFGGSGSLAQSGATVVLSGANTFSGGYTLTSGTVTPGHDSAFGSGTLTLAGGTLLSSASRTLANPVAVTGAATIDPSTHTLTLSGVLSGSGALIKTGAGTLTLGGASANTFTGTTTVNAGTLVLAKPAGDGTNNYGSALRGDLVINSGATVRLGASDQHDDTKLLHVAGGTLDLNGYTEGTSSELRLTGGTVSGAGTFNLLGTLAATNFTPSGENPSTISSVLNLMGGTRIFSLNSTLSLSGAATNGTFTQTGGGTLALSGAADNASLVANLSSGTLELSKTSSATVHALGAGAHSVAAGATLRLAGTGGDQIFDQSTLALAGTLNLNGRNETLSLLTGAGHVESTSTATLTVGHLDATGTFSGSTSGSVSLGKIGTGTFTLAGSADNVSLGATVSAGTLVLAKTSGGSVHALNAATTVASGATLRLAGTGGDQIADTVALTVNGTLDLATRAETVAALAGSGLVTTVGGSATLTVGPDGTSSSFTGTLSRDGVSDTLGLVKAGTGTLTLGGTADNVGLVATVAAGNLTLAKASSATVHALGGGTHTVASGATLALGGTGGDQIFDSATVSLGGGTLDLNARTETIAHLSGTGQMTNSSGSGALTVGSGDVSGSFSGTTGKHVAAGDLTLGKIGTGTFTLDGTGDNSFLAANVGAGTLVLAKASSATVHALGGNSTVAAGATLRLAGTGGDQIFDHASLSVNGTFDLAGRAETIAALTGTGTVNSSSAGGVLTVGFNNTSAAFSGTTAPGGGSVTFAKVGTGTVTLDGTGDNDSLAASVQAGTLLLAKTSSASVHALGGGTHTVAAGATLRLAGTGGDQIYDHGSVSVAGNFDLAGRAETIAALTGAGTVTSSAGAGTLTLGFNNTSATFAGTVANGAGTVGLAKIGTGTLTLSGTNSYTGTTAITAGTLRLTGTAANSAFTVSPGATLTGNGTLGPLAVHGTLSPGLSPGTLGAGNTVFHSGGSLLWEINNASGTAGTNWDLLAITGTLDVAATSAGRFTLNLVSLLPDNTAGAVINFDPAQNYSYTLATTTGGILGFAATDFTVNTSSFTNSLNGGVWSVGKAGNNLVLNFTASAIPEPSTYAIIFGAGALAFAASRRRKK